MELLILLGLLLALDLAVSRWATTPAMATTGSPDDNAGDTSGKGGLMLAAVGRFAVRWRRWVLAGTLLAVVVAGALGGGVFDRLSGGGFSDHDAEFSRARDQLEQVFGAGDPNLVLLVTAKRGSVDDPATAAVGAALTRQLVVGGPYRYVRKPMYLAVTATIVGQALAIGQPGLLLYAAAVAGAMAAFAHGHEEPTLCRRFGAQYEAYRQAVPAWWPRRHPWQPGQANQPAHHQA